MNRGEAGISGGLEHGFLDGSVVEPGDGDRPRDAAAMELHGGDGCQDEDDAVKKASQKTRTTTRFGARLREKRLEKQITLRKFADMIGVSSTYLSQVEQGRYDPPTADRVRQIAKILGEDADLWIGLADRVPEDMEEIVKEHPKEMPELLRAARGLTPEQFAKLQQTIKRMKTKG
ncbi:helix-turn-helix domain-containing protein [Crateriforma spongiae]|uniref:helix-turn-helix domain-containing protein n=1 Tax=Crateriforma spongiae TaxID=2724528 RepID=UPI0039B04949